MEVNGAGISAPSTVSTPSAGAAGSVDPGFEGEATLYEPTTQINGEVNVASNAGVDKNVDETDVEALATKQGTAHEKLVELSEHEKTETEQNEQAPDQEQQPTEEESINSGKETFDEALKRVQQETIDLMNKRFEDRSLQLAASALDLMRDVTKLLYMLNAEMDDEKKKKKKTLLRVLLGMISSIVVSVIGDVVEDTETELKKA